MSNTSDLLQAILYKEFITTQEKINKLQRRQIKELERRIEILETKKSE